MSSTRIEKYFLGTKEIPADAYCGVHTARALEHLIATFEERAEAFKDIFQLIDIIKRAMRILADRCVKGITPNTEHCQKNLDAAITLVTLLNPQLGYEVAAELAMEALAGQRSIRELVLERDLMSSEAYDALVKASASLD